MSKVIVDEIQTDTTDGNVRIIPNGAGKLEVKGAGGDDAMLQLNCSAQTHGVKLKSPAHTHGQEYTMILPDNNIAADKYLKVKSIASGSGTSAVGQLEFADVAAGVTSDARENTVAGTDSGSNFDGTNATDNTLFGYKAGEDITSGTHNTTFGRAAGTDITSGGSNTCIGSNAGHKLTTQLSNTFVGAYSGYNQTGEGRNTGLGQGTLYALTTGSYNVALGDACLMMLTTGNHNVCAGRLAGYNMTTGSYNSIFGHEAGKAITTGGYNLLLGLESGYSITTANFNTGVGNNTLYTCTTGGSNTANGRWSLYNLTTGSLNSCLGRNSGVNITTGENNICIGYQAGATSSPSGQITTGSNNVVLGNNSISNLYCADASISSSDSRDKTDVTDFTKGLEWIEALRPVTFRWDRRTWYGTEEEPYGTPDGSKKRQRLHLGFLAQEALAVEQANGYGNSNDDSLILNLTDDGMSYGMKYERLVPILVNAIKELSTRVKTLEGG